MGASPFTYLAYDLTSWSRLDPLPYSNVNFGQVVNAPGPFSAELAIADPRMSALDWQDATRPSRTALFVDYLGTLVWGGIAWTRQWDEFANPRTLKIAGSSFTSILKQRLQAADYTSTWAAGGDPMTIASTVAAAAFAESGGVIGGGVTIALNPPAGSGQSVAVSYPATQLQTIDSIISTLANMGYSYGFDYSMDVAYLPGTSTPGITLNVWYPRQGRTAANSNIVVMHRDSIGFTYDEDGTKQLTSLTESGAGGVPPATLSVPSVIATGYPLLEGVSSRSQINDTGLLANVAASDLALIAYPPVTPTVTLPLPLPDPVNFPHQPGNLDPSQLHFGDFNLGDDLTYIITAAPLDVNGNLSYGKNNSPRFPNGYNFTWRINAWTCTVADSGPSSLAFDLGTPPATLLPPTPAPIA